MTKVRFNEKGRELQIERVIDAPRDIVGRCWTENDLIMKWFCPKPWRLTVSDLDVRAGGRMNNVMEGPNGERMENVGCFLEVVPQERLIFTNAYAEGFLPQPEPFMTGVVELSDTRDGRTQLIWSARHPTEKTYKQHIKMGFEKGWTVASLQLNELAGSIAEERNK